MQDQNVYLENEHISYKTPYLTAFISCFHIQVFTYTNGNMVQSIQTFSNIIYKQLAILIKTAKVT